MFLGSPWTMRNPAHFKFSHHMPPPTAKNRKQTHSFNSVIEFNVGRIYTVRGHPRVLSFPGKVSAKAKVTVVVNFESEEKATKTRKFTTELRQLDADKIQIGKGRFSKRVFGKLSQ